MSDTWNTRVGLDPIEFLGLSILLFFQPVISLA